MKPTPIVGKRVPQGLAGLRLRIKRYNADAKRLRPLRPSKADEESPGTTGLVAG